MYNNNYMLDSLNRQKERIDEMIRNYQQPQQPVNNFINTGQTQNEKLYELKVLNDGDEVENIFVNQNTLFLGTNRLQIKKTDGTIEKYNITKIFPLDPKDERINALEEEIKKLKEMINNEHSESIKSVRECEQSNVNVDGNVKSESKKSSKSISE